MERTAPSTGISATNVAKKALMAVSGLVLVAFVVGHLLGNLLFYVGPAALNEYSAFLQKSTGLLWTARVILLVSVLVHIVVALDLYTRKSSARPVAYGRYTRTQASLGSRTMIWTGVVLLGFIVYHLLHLTLGVVHPAFIEHDVYDNVVRGFAVVPVSVFYWIGMTALGLHLSHGLWSMTQSVGISLRRDGMRGVRRLALFIGVLLALGFASIPLTVVLATAGR